MGGKIWACDLSAGEWNAVTCREFDDPPRIFQSRAATMVAHKSLSTGGDRGIESGPRFRNAK